MRIDGIETKIPRVSEPGRGGLAGSGGLEALAQAQAGAENFREVGAVLAGRL